MERTDSKIDTPEAQSGSQPVLYEVVGPRGSRDEAKRAGEKKWPGMDTANLDDEHPTGWFIQVVGADKPSH